MQEERDKIAEALVQEFLKSGWTHAEIETNEDGEPVLVCVEELPIDESMSPQMIVKKFVDMQKRNAFVKIPENVDQAKWLDSLRYYSKKMNVDVMKGRKDVTLINKSIIVKPKKKELPYISLMKDVTPEQMEKELHKLRGLYARRQRT